MKTEGRNLAGWFVGLLQVLERLPSVLEQSVVEQGGGGGVKAEDSCHGGQDASGTCYIVMNSRRTSSIIILSSFPMPSLRYRLCCAFWIAGMTGLPASLALRRTVDMLKLRR